MCFFLQSPWLPSLGYTGLRGHEWRSSQNGSPVVGGEGNSLVSGAVASHAGRASQGRDPCRPGSRFKLLLWQRRWEVTWRACRVAVVRPGVYTVRSVYLRSTYCPSACVCLGAVKSAVEGWVQSFDASLRERLFTDTLWIPMTTEYLCTVQ